MKIIAESPEENKYLEMVEKVLLEKKIPCFYTETFEESFIKEAVSNSISIDLQSSIEEWSTSQRLWFLDKCKEFFNEPVYRDLKNDYLNFVGIYDQIFKEERKALDIAADDYRLFLNIKRNCELLHVNSFNKLKKFLMHSTVKGKDKDIKDVYCYFDTSFSQYAIKLNSLKIPFVFNDGKIIEGCVIYACNEVDLQNDYEFLKNEIMNRMKEQDNSKSTLDVKISVASKKNSLFDFHHNKTIKKELTK